jgi:outer membrane lipoprotein-sorting protein
LWLAVLTCLIAFGRAAEAQGTGVTPTNFDLVTPQPLIPEATNGAPLVSALLKSIKEFKSYRFRAAVRALKDGKFKDSAGTFYFKAPNLVRVEVEGHGPKAGSKLIRNASGQIRFKGGPALFGITMTLEPDSRFLRLPSGHLVTECDYASLLQDLSKKIAAGLEVTTSPAAITLNHEPGKAIILEAREPGQSANFVSQRFLIDPKTNVPISWARFKNGKLNATVKFENPRINLDLGDDMFNL